MSEATEGRTRFGKSQQALAMTVLLALGCGAGGPDGKIKKGEIASSEGSELRLSDDAVLGYFVSGSSSTVSYQSPPKYRAFWFYGSAGDQVDFRIHSDDGDAVAWLADERMKSIAYNDDADSSTTDAQLVVTLPKTSQYYVVFRERDHESATFVVTGSYGQTSDGGYNDGGYYDGGYSDGGYSDGGYNDGGSYDGGYYDGGYYDGGYSDGGYSDGGYSDGGYYDGGYYDGGYSDGGYYDGGYYDGGSYDGGE